MNLHAPDVLGAEVERLLAALPVIRPLRSGDRALFDAFVRDLSPSSRFRRFHAAFNELPDVLLERLTRADTLGGEIGDMSTQSNAGFLARILDSAWLQRSRDRGWKRWLAKIVREGGLSWLT
jgi:hypothetical protein